MGGSLYLEEPGALFQSWDQNPRGIVPFRWLLPSRCTDTSNSNQALLGRCPELSSAFPVVLPSQGGLAAPTPRPTGAFSLPGDIRDSGPQSCPRHTGCDLSRTLTSTFLTWSVLAAGQPCLGLKSPPQTVPFSHQQVTPSARDTHSSLSSSEKTRLMSPFQEARSDLRLVRAS